MRRISVLLILATVCSAYAQPNPDGFVPGHIFIGEIELEPCYGPLSGESFIREIDPDTGRSWILADSSTGLCIVHGLTFTPDGNALRALGQADISVMDFDSAGNGSVIYDRTLGFGIPGGQNALAFDRLGYFYLYSGDRLEILRFPPDGSVPPTVFADRWDGLLSRGAGGMAFSRGGDLFVANNNRHVLRFDPDGEVSVFDEFPVGQDPLTLAFDRQGNLFVGVEAFGSSRIYRYDGGRVENKRLLGEIPGFFYFTLTLSLDQREIYVTTEAAVYAYDANSGARRVLHTFPRGNDRTFGGLGIAVYVPPTPGDIDCDQWVNAFDIEPFILALFDPQAYQARWPHCDLMRADLNGDGSVNAFDIEPFLDVLFGP